LKLTWDEVQKYPPPLSAKLPVTLGEVRLRIDIEAKIPPPYLAMLFITVRSIAVRELDSLMGVRGMLMLQVTLQKYRHQNLCLGYL
jgi:hypothetical protein